MYTWIRATTATICEVVRQHLQADAELQAVFASNTVSPATPEEMKTDSVTGLSVWLYRIVRDDQLLNHPPRRIAFNQIERRRLPLRLHYLMTPIVNGTADGSGPRMEQAILGKVLQTFHDHPILSGADLQDDLAGSGMEICVRLEPLNLEEISRVWDALGESYQLCVSYEVSVVLIASDKEPVRAGIVDVLDPEYGLASPETVP